jgi:hypothetical protein
MSNVSNSTSDVNDASDTNDATKGTERKQPQSHARTPRTPARKKAKELAKYLRGERLDYLYMKELFRYLREELEIKIQATTEVTLCTH